MAFWRSTRAMITSSASRSCWTLELFASVACLMLIRLTNTAAHMAATTVTTTAKPTTSFLEMFRLFRRFIGVSAFWRIGGEEAATRGQPSRRPGVQWTYGAVRLQTVGGLKRPHGNLAVAVRA